MDGYGISSRTLRYYEQVGILWSSHPDNKAQRYYGTDALERLKQIIVLRKLQIPIILFSAVRSKILGGS
ncbi:MAG: MerR family transcriptional regulator [Clostridiales bacterium]|nr:MerR family transcriptional regulator [Clostridiales bacterium]